ncbi:26S proteasome non-ATPase regulatory subunit 13-like B [Vitis vinifera]|uniref:26S proteasome non-ATPase regulatory subunit 13-like B n=1 Tax=Vitis vinifera TaxID=29760 RepID=A0A438H8D3_VITVI|nr:26S proteasome non-ATPase regulatory subunit 13-like B [Vitis vinifera]
MKEEEKEKRSAYLVGPSEATRATASRLAGGECLARLSGAFVKGRRLSSSEAPEGGVAPPEPRRSLGAPFRTMVGLWTCLVCYIVVTYLAHYLGGVSAAPFGQGVKSLQSVNEDDKRDENQISCLALQDLFVAGDALIQQYTEKEAAVRYLEGVIEKLRGTRELRIEEPILYIKMQIAVFNLEKGDQKECKKLLEDGKSTLDSMTDIDPSVYASYYWVSSQYYKSRQEFAEFYKSALLYLAYTSVESLSETFKLAASMETEKEKTGWDLAFDLSLSALLGDNIYNFGELLAHPIVRILYQKFLILCLFFHLYLN